MEETSTMEFPSALFELRDLFNGAGFGLRPVGGCVRDTLMGVEPKDFDLCTDATPDEMIDLARRSGHHLIPTGLQHGTATFVIDRVPYEVTTLRMDVACDGRHAEVAFTRDWRADAERRDLTINAMIVDFDGGLYDWFGGRDDIRDRTLRFVGDADTRIREDYLRILRFLRFAGKFPDGQASFDPQGMEAVARNASGLATISVERIWSEVSRILDGRRAADLGQIMLDAGICAVIGMPWADRGRAAEVSVRGGSAFAVLAAQLASEDEAVELAARWKMSADERRRLTFLTTNRDSARTETIEDALVDGVSRDWAIDLARLAGLTDEVAATFLPPAFPVQGKDLLALGMAPGPVMGTTLKAMRGRWVASRFTLTREALLAGHAR